MTNITSRGLKSTPTPSALVCANIRMFSIPSDDGMGVFTANNYTVELFVFIVGFLMVVDNAMVAVATPSLPQSILLLSNNDLPTAHHPTPSYRYYWRTSLRGGKFVPPKLIPPISFYY